MVTYYGDMELVQSLCSFADKSSRVASCIASMWVLVYPGGIFSFNVTIPVAQHWGVVVTQAEHFRSL